MEKRGKEKKPVVPAAVVVCVVSVVCLAVNTTDLFSAGLGGGWYMVGFHYPSAALLS